MQSVPKREHDKEKKGQIVTKCTNTNNNKKVSRKFLETLVDKFL